MNPSPSGGLPGTRLVAGYRGHLSGPDELLAPSGQVRQAGSALAAAVDALGLSGLLTLRADAARAVEDDGVTYGIDPLAGAGVSGAPRPGLGPGYAGGRGWRLDPLPVVLDAAQWAQLSAGLTQRAELLDLVLADLYGARHLIRQGILPPEVVFGHPGFLRQVDGMRVPGPRQLFSLATDLARDADGVWRVLGDRAQAPSGAGYAMENRRVVARVLPGLYRDTELERLRAFFHTMREALQEVAPAGAEVPRVVLLTPGPASETAFDQAFLAGLLGYPLVTGADLSVRDGRVYLRSLGRPEPVDVVLRRVDADFTDPLELRPESRLGVPGLLEACRLGRVTVVNTLGSGVLENPALMPFLPVACADLLDQDLLLPSVPTWWCGDPAGRSHVLAHLDELVLKPVGRAAGRASRFGGELSAVARAELRRRIEAEPACWVGQELLSASTAPVVTALGLEPRRMVLRTFAVAQGGRYRLMSGGLARVAGSVHGRDVSSAAGAVAKDVWVLRSAGTAAAVTGPRGLGAVLPLRTVAPAAAMASRSAEDLFWLGRYAERAEDTVRLLRVADDLAGDHAARPGTPEAAVLHTVLRTLTAVTTTYPGFVGEGAAERLAAPHGELLDLVVDAARPGTLAHAVRRTVESARAVRDQLSLDTWIVLGSLERVLAELAARAQEHVPGGGTVPGLQPTLGRVLEGFLALAGLGAESMIRDPGWYFFDAGRRIERAWQVLAMLRQVLGAQVPAQARGLALESTLIVGESIVTHRRRHQGRARADTVLDLLVRDRENPRAVGYQLDRLREDLTHLPGRSVAQQELTALVRELADRTRQVDLVPAPGAVGAGALDAVVLGLEDLAVALERHYFVHLAPPRVMAATPGWDA